MGQRDWYGKAMILPASIDCMRKCLISPWRQSWERVFSQAQVSWCMHECLCKTLSPDPMAKLHSLIVTLIKKDCDDFFYHNFHLFFPICARKDFENFSLLRYRISSYSFRPWIVSAPLCTLTFVLMYCDLWISKFKKE